jgi:hypothetical protein
MQWLQSPVTAFTAGSGEYATDDDDDDYYYYYFMLIL